MKHITRIFFVLFFLSVATFPVQASTTLVEGKQYITLKNQVKEAPTVVEFFSFYCPACSSFYSPYQVSKKIDAQLPEGIKVEKYHTGFMGEMGEQLTVAWSIAKALGVEDKVEGPLFNAVLKQKSIKTEDDIKNVFVQSGINGEEYDLAKNSLMVKVLTSRQIKAAKEFAITGTPSFYVKGKYQVKNNGIADTSVEGYGKEYAEIVRKLIDKHS